MDVDSPAIDNSSSPAEKTSDWRQAYVQYLTTNELPEYEHLASKVKKNAFIYSITEGQLYRKPVSLEPFLRCISTEEGQQILAEVHEGICGNHSGGAQFGIPDAIISDNGKQFDSGVIQDFCKNLNIRHNFSTPYYAQSNGQAEATNRVIMDNLKKGLEQAKGKWTEEFPGVLWSYRTTLKRSTGFSPFTLAYGTKVVIPTEVHLKTTKTRAVKSGKNDSILALDKELLKNRDILAAVSPIPAGNQVEI
ncbi:uncharacterized protein LOC113312102 [Papaver somniferum]|uniref:uncharacterized protein LOC113312102 n=1 Tax=Papaver somniferum TaxID=3469 RepID=UPI000E6F7666|nr:uncharacterized protein LOC113312102 [Papaver somniferum]